MEGYITKEKSMYKLSNQSINSTTYNKLITFLQNHGESELNKALDLYSDMYEKYVCKTKTSISKISISDIYYIKINGHNMTIYTEQEIFSKYGSLAQELSLLSKYGFIKCSQNCIVSVNRIKQIVHDDIILTNNDKLHISRSCISNVLMTFNQQKNPIR